MKPLITTAEASCQSPGHMRIPVLLVFLPPLFCLASVAYYFSSMQPNAIQYLETSNYGGR